MNNNIKNLDELLSRIATDRIFRIAMTKESHVLFFLTYFRHHMGFPLARFHFEILNITEDFETPISVVVAFRSSGKTTICSLSFPIWSVLSDRKKFVLVISKTEPQIRQMLYNIKMELETNLDLISDYGPFHADDTWNEQSLVIPSYGARITGLSAEQSLRGLKHLEQRPDLIILDDVEDLDSVRSFETREKRYRWLKSEVIPAGSDDCKILIVGNPLHEDSLVSRLKEEIANGDLRGLAKQYPIIVKNSPLWKSKFPDLAAIEELKKKIGDNRAFDSEYLLKITHTYDQVVRKEWIRRYKYLPHIDPTIVPEQLRLDLIATGMDFAVSQKDSADYTASVTTIVYRVYEPPDDLSSDFYAFILPIITNDRMTVDRIIGRAKYIEDITKGFVPDGDSHSHRFFLEDAGQQKAIIEPMQRAGLYITEVPTEGLDKRSRLALAAQFMEQGRIFFPHKGTELLEQQLLNFGSTRYDDLADAFSTLMREMRRQVNNGPRILWL